MHPLKVESMLAAGILVAFLARPADAQTFTPASNAKKICPDTPLQLSFAAAPAMPATGRIEIHDAADDSVAASIDLAQPTATQTIGGLPNYVYRPFTVANNVLTLHFPNHALAYNKTYYVTLPTALLPDHPAPDKQTWRFSTKAAPPAAEAAQVTVSPDSTADFASIQAAIDFFPEGNKLPRTLLIRPGTYNEILCILRRDNLTLLGADRKRTIIAYANSDRFNPNVGGNPFGPGAPQPGAADPKTGAVYRRGVLLAHQSHGLTLANLTIHNTTPKGGSQAETIILNGTTDAQAVLADLDLYSFQDTVQFNGQTYIHDCYIEGDVDFIWGTGPCFFDHVHAQALNNSAVFTTMRNPPANHGFVFKDCTLDGAAGTTAATLARIELNRFPASEVVLLNTTLAAVLPVAWRTSGSGDTANLHFWELNSHDAEGKPVDVSRRLALSKQLTEPADHETIAHYSDPKFVLGNDWTPVLPKIPAP